jgi:hypothetical protein
MTRRARSIIVFLTVWWIGGGLWMGMAQQLLKEGALRDNVSFGGVIGCFVLGFWLHRRIERGGSPGDPRPS